jgi:NADH-quinone oxidoreductase subunit F
VEILDRIRMGRGSLEDLALIRRTSSYVVELSLCGLGQVAPVPLVAFLDVYEEEFRQHIVDGYCKTGTCPISAHPRHTALVESAAD